MTAALANVYEELLITAMTKLTAQIKAETDPRRLEKLLATALRTRPLTQPRPTPHTPAQPDPQPDTTPDAAPTPPHPAPEYMTDDEFLRLQREFGYTEANRRRLQCAQTVHFYTRKSDPAPPAPA